MNISYKDSKAALDEAKRLGTPTDTGARLLDTRRIVNLPRNAA